MESQLSNYENNEIAYYPLYKWQWLLFVCVHANTIPTRQLANYIHACTNVTHSIANLQDLIPTLAAIIIGNTNYQSQSTQGLNPVDLLQNVFHLCMHGRNQLPSWIFICMNKHKTNGSHCSLYSGQSAISLFSKLDSQLAAYFFTYYWILTSF